LQERSSSYSNIAAALEAGIITLQLLGNASMPRELYIQEVVEQLLDVVKYTLQHNVLVFLDAKLRKKWQPEGIGVHAPRRSAPGTVAAMRACIVMNSLPQSSFPKSFVRV
jgi:thiamine monophosphate synthase